MNEAQTNAALAALEKQRNSALNQVVNTEVALAITQAKVAELEKEVARLSALLAATPVPPKEGP